MLILPDAYRLRIDLHELGQRVLQAARYRHGRALRGVEIRELLGPRLGRRVDRRSGFRHDGIAAFWRHAAEHAGDEYDALLRRRSVAHGDILHAVLLYRAEHYLLAFGEPLLRLCGIDDPRPEHLSGAVDDGQLAAGPVSGVETHDRHPLKGRLHQQLLRVLAEKLYRALGGGVGQFVPDLALDRGSDVL